MRYSSAFTIDLNRLSSNVRKIQSRCPENKILAMVKANAYGHGITEVSLKLKEDRLVEDFGVASLAEAVVLRETLQDYGEIYVFSDLQFDEENFRELYLNRRLIPVLSSIKDLQLFLEDQRFQYFPLCLKFNTGMNRLGISWTEVDNVSKLLKQFQRKEIFHLMSHLACASLSIEKNKRNREQFERFEKLKEYFSSAGIKMLSTSLANSGAIEQGAGLSETHVRPGLMMYGPSSLIPDLRLEFPWDGENISKLETKILTIRTVDRGTPVGYGSNPVPFGGNMAIVALGYGDGIRTSYQGSTIEHLGVLGKIVGRVNMDMTQILFPENTSLKTGDSIQFWGFDPAQIMRLSDESGIIPYEILLSITSRVPRIYL